MEGPSLTDIGRIFNKDHCTVLNAIRKMEDINSVYKRDFARFNSIVDHLKEYIIIKSGTDPDYANELESLKYYKNKARKFL